MSNAVQGPILDFLASSPPGDGDASLLARFVSERDEEAFAALVRRHSALVYGTCHRILGNPSDSDDAFQAVFFVLARRAISLKLDRGIGPWLHGVAVRVALKLRGQIVRRRLREMSAAKSDRVESTPSGDDFWAVIDEELARMSPSHREVAILCDLGGQSHAQAAATLGVAKGTVSKRLTRARAELARRLQRRGIVLSVAAISTLIESRAVGSVAAPLLSETVKRAVAFSVGPVGGSITAPSLAEAVMRSMQLGVLRSWLGIGLLVAMIASGGLMLAGGPDSPDDKKPTPPKPSEKSAVVEGTMWKESYAVDYTGSLPVSVAYSADGRTLLTGDTNGEAMALIFPGDSAQYRWKTNVGGTHAAVAYSADHKHVYVTTENGVRVLSEPLGKEEARIEVPGAHPNAIGVFPNKAITAEVVQTQIVIGDASGYFVKSWMNGKFETIGTIQTQTVPKGKKPVDATAVPLAVDPKGSSAIMTGPIDATGEAGGVKGKNILWAYVCGDYSKGSPGNRVMAGHAATVVSAAWARNGATAVTGDADGQVIVWDARTMKELRRVELGGRVMALAITEDGSRTAAYVRGKQGAEVHVWETAKPLTGSKPIHSQPADFGFEPFASLSFTPDGRRLAGCALDKKWLQTIPKAQLTGQVHVWELIAEPKNQHPPRLAYTKSLGKGSSVNMVMVNNESLITPADRPGAIDYRRVADGEIQFRLGLGDFVIGGMKLSTDRKWLAIEQHTPVDPRTTGKPTTTFDVGVFEVLKLQKATISSCSQLLDIVSGGKVVAVVRENKIVLWDVAANKELKSASFKHTRIDAARFSPDGKRLAISDRNELVLWQWEEDKHVRIDLGRCVGSLAFTPDGKFLAEGPTPRDNIQVRDVETHKVVQELFNGKKQSMNVPRLTYAQGGRVLIACDNITLIKKIEVPHRITLWDTATGAVAHQIELPSGLPHHMEVSPNGRYLVATLDDGENGLKLCGWRLDGALPAKGGPEPRPATPVRP